MVWMEEVGHWGHAFEGSLILVPSEIFCLSVSQSMSLPPLLLLSASLSLLAPLSSGLTMG